jgi:ribosomal-protein-alanine N-acetyltransferase
MKLFRKSTDSPQKSMAKFLAMTPLNMTQDMLEQVLLIEQGAYSHPWTRGNFVDSIISGYHMPVWFHEQELLCYLVAMRGADEAHLLNITVAPDHHRQGLAHAMLTHLQTWGQAQGVHSLWLEVRISNQRAIDIYTAFGFVQDGVRRDYYPAQSGVREDAVVMSLTW